MKHTIYTVASYLHKGKDCIALRSPEMEPSESTESYPDDGLEMAIHS